MAEIPKALSRMWPGKISVATVGAMGPFEKQ